LKGGLCGGVSRKNLPVGFKDASGLDCMATEEGSDIGILNVKVELCHELTSERAKGYAPLPLATARRRRKLLTAEDLLYVLEHALRLLVKDAERVVYLGLGLLFCHLAPRPRWQV
jgi:hypothetical protein